jgi:hypothetical protein
VASRRRVGAAPGRVSGALKATVFRGDPVLTHDEVPGRREVFQAVPEDRRGLLKMSAYAAVIDKRNATTPRAQPSRFFTRF